MSLFEEEKKTMTLLLPHILLAHSDSVLEHCISSAFQLSREVISCANIAEVFFASERLSLCIALGDDTISNRLSIELIASLRLSRPSLPVIGIVTDGSFCQGIIQAGACLINPFHIRALRSCFREESHFCNRTP